MNDVRGKSFDNPMYIIKRTTTYKICGVIRKKKEGLE